MTDKPYLLVVEDDPGIQAQLSWSFENYEVLTASNQKEALTMLRRYEPGVVTLDLGLPPDPDGVDEGLDTLKAILRLKPLTKVIVVTGQSDRQHALAAISCGAYDFYIKPIDKDILSLIVDRAFHLYEIEETLRSKSLYDATTKIPNLITGAANMLQVCRTVEKIAPTDITCLLRGESGTGKEVIASGLHQLSSRAREPFIAINCAAIPENLLESELFGYEKGAFTGAVKQTPGKIEAAHKGTLFLDEIGDLPMSLQPKLLRFLQERKIERLGGRKEIEVDVRVICATHQPLEELIQAQTFREDLFYRISEIGIDIPPLRDRAQDALMLAQSFLKTFAKLYNAKVKGMSEEAKSAILEYSWPGNVRELENKIKRAVVMCDLTKITPEDLDLAFSGQGFAFNLKEVREEAERQAIQRALTYCSGNMTKASELLGVTRPTLYHMLDKLSSDKKVENSPS